MMGKDKEDTKSRRRDRFKRLWTRPRGGPEGSSSSRPPTNEVISSDDVPIPSTSIVETEPVGSHSSEQIKQNSSEIGLWVRAADSLDPKDREKLDKVVGCNQESPHGSKGHSLAEDVDSTLARAENLRGESAEATWTPVVDKIIKGALAFKSVGDAATAFDKSGYAALGWSVVSFGLQVAANMEEAREFVLSSSEVIARFMAKYRQYEKIFRGPDAGENFDRHLMNVYKAILLYMIALDQYLRQSGFRHLAHATFKLEDRSINSSKKAIDTADAEISDWLLIILQQRNDSNFSQIRSMLQGHNLPQVPVPAQECLKSLAFPEMEDRFNDIERAAEGTCKWLLGHNKYREWADASRGLLCIKGKPGSGKSTLLRYAVGDASVSSAIQERSTSLHKEHPRVGGETLEAQGEPGALILSFFFHDRGSELQKTTLGLFRTLLHRLLSHVPVAIPARLLETFQYRRDNRGKPGEEWHWHERELRDFFEESLLEVLRIRPVCLLVDALDEHGKDNANELLRSFTSWLQKCPPLSQLRICFTCRHHPPLVFPQNMSEIRLEDENSSDISTYVRSRLSAWSSSEPLAAIREEVTVRASGIFMWARLVVARVLELEAEGENWIRIREEVAATPLELDELYRGLIEKAVDKPNSLKMIQWICFAIEPLSLDELRWAMAIEPDRSCNPNSLQHYQTTKHFASNCDMMEKRLKALSCGLAETVQSTREVLCTEWGDRRTISYHAVQFIHQSVKDFFIRMGLVALMSSQAPATTKTNRAELEATAHHQLSRSCIRYFSAEEIMQSKLPSDELDYAFPLLRYVSQHWIAHVQQSEKEVPQTNLLDCFGWPSEAIVEHWTRIYRSLRLGSVYNNTTMLHIASQHRLMGPLQGILQRKELLTGGIDAIDGENPTPLWLAVDRGHEDIVRILLDNGADANGNCGSYGYALQEAAHRGNKHIATVLLQNGARVNEQSGFLDNALQAALSRGHEHTAQLLLEYGADVNAPVKKYGTALIAASVHGDSQTTQLLLEHGADVNAQVWEYGTALIAASSHGNEQIVQLLLEKGATIDTYAGKDTALLVAATNGREKIVEMLLEKGAEVNYSGEPECQPLAAAAAEGSVNEGIVATLLEKGADVNARSWRYGCALIAAVQRGFENEGIVRKLLEKGADVNAQGPGGYPRNSLQVAIEGGNQQIANLLREYGAV